MRRYAQPAICSGRRYEHRADAGIIDAGAFVMRAARAFTILELLVVLAIVALVWMVIALGRSDERDREAFMAECLQHRPQYECTAMWRAGERSTTFMFIPR